MTRNAFERIEEVYGLNGAIAEMRDERILNWEDVADLAVACLYEREFQKAKTLIALIEDEDAERFWVWRRKNELPTLIESAEDIDFLFAKEDDEWLPERDDDWCNRQGIM